MLKILLNTSILISGMFLLSACGSHTESNHTFGSNTHHLNNVKNISLYIPGNKVTASQKNTIIGSNTHHYNPQDTITSLYISGKKAPAIKESILGSNTHHYKN